MREDGCVFFTRQGGGEESYKHLSCYQSLRVNVNQKEMKR